MANYLFEDLLFLEANGLSLALETYCWTAHGIVVSWTGVSLHRKCIAKKHRKDSNIGLAFYEFLFPRPIDIEISKDTAYFFGSLCLGIANLLIESLMSSRPTVHQ